MIVLIVLIYAIIGFICWLALYTGCCYEYKTLRNGGYNIKFDEWYSRSCYDTRCIYTSIFWPIGIIGILLYFVFSLCTSSIKRAFKID